MHSEKEMNEMMKKKMMEDEKSKKKVKKDASPKMEKGHTPEMHSNVHESTITKNVYPRDLETTD